MADPFNMGLGTTATNPYLGKENPQLDSLVNRAQGDMVRNYNLTAQPAYNAGQIRSGSFGNSGIQELNENAQKNMQSSLGNVSAQMRGQDYTNQGQMYQWQQQQDANNQQFNLGFGRNVYNDAYSQNMNNLQTGVNLLGTMNGYTGQDINNSTQQQNTPMNYWNQFQGASNGIANGFGTTTNTMGTSSNPVMGAIGGAQLGKSAMDWWNKPSAGSGGGTTNQGFPAYSGGGATNAYGSQYTPYDF